MRLSTKYYLALVVSIILLGLTSSNTYIMFLFMCGCLAGVLFGRVAAEERQGKHNQNKIKLEEVK